MNLPNKISLARIFFVPVLMAIFLLNEYIPFAYVIVSFLFIIGASTDFVDGMIARKRGLVTNLGKFLDPIADKLLVCSLLILMCGNAELFIPGAGWFLIVSTIIIIMREIIIGGFRQVAAARGIVLAADKLGKLKTIMQDIAIPTLLFAQAFFNQGIEFMDTIGYVIRYSGYAVLAFAVIMTIWSGISYIVKNKQVLKEQD